MDIEYVYNLIDELNLEECIEKKLALKKLPKISYDMSIKWKIYYDVLTDKQIEIKNISEKRRKELGLSLLNQTNDKQIYNYSLMLKKIEKAKSILNESIIRDETLK